jgi:hypothetical protein
MSNPIPTRVGRYEVIRLVGKGNQRNTEPAFRPTVGFCGDESLWAVAALVAIKDRLDVAVSVSKK